MMNFGVNGFGLPDLLEHATAEHPYHLQRHQNSVHHLVLRSSPGPSLGDTARQPRVILRGEERGRKRKLTRNSNERQTS